MIINSQPYEMSSKPIAVNIEGICKSYRCGNTVTPVLEGVDLVAQREECVFLTGPSGSGKTTLLSILGCILSADRGRAQILGEDIFALDEEARTTLRRERLGFVFQRFHLIRGLTSLDNVCVPLALRGTSPLKAHDRGMALLDTVGLADKAKMHPRNLSAGECQRVALARALSGDPDLLLADEPTASLDATNGQEVMQLLRRLTTQEGRTAIIVTHDQRIFHFADKRFYLENGRIAEAPESRSTALPESEQ